MTVVTTGTEKKLPFFSKFEVAEHCISADCWVSYFGKVYDLTTLIKTHNGPLTQPILKFAGQDISHWFDARTKEVSANTHERREGGFEQ